jgi:NAD(P)-dependent dehydrogenase (short-subunit alcohol dehydrogenase family)
MILAGTVALVTGGSQGIGKAIAERFAAEGAAVAVVASSSKDKAAKVVETLPGAAERHLAAACDVRDGEAVKALVDEVAKRFGKIDTLVNSAGVFYPTPVGATPKLDSDRMIGINLVGVWNLIDAVAPDMKARKSGQIINISSVAGSMGISGYSLYCGVKAAIIMMTRALALELAPSGVRVNCIAPGNTATPMNEDIRTKPELKHFLDGMTARTPSGRTYSEPEDMAAIAAFLASDESRAMHGAVVLADEGFSAGI